MKPDKIEPKKISTKFNAYCTHCKQVVEIPKDKELLKELKGYVEEGKEKYHDSYAIAREIINGCPLCHRNIRIRAKSYVDFYDTKKAKKAKELVNEVAKDLEEDIKQTALENMPE